VPKYEGQNTCCTVAVLLCIEANCTGLVRAEHMESNFVLRLTYTKGLSSSTSSSAGLKIWAVAGAVPVRLIPAT